MMLVVNEKSCCCLASSREQGCSVKARDTRKAVDCIVEEGTTTRITSIAIKTVRAMYELGEARIFAV
jgi:hypothetical protein